MRSWRLHGPDQHPHSVRVAEDLHASPSFQARRSLRQADRCRGLANDALTIYDNGAIHYRDSLQRRFEGEQLSQEELSDLLHAFAVARFDALPHADRPRNWWSLPGITLSARGCRMSGWLTTPNACTAGAEDGCTGDTRDTSTYLLLKTGQRRNEKMSHSPYNAIKLDGFLASEYGVLGACVWISDWAGRCSRFCRAAA